MQIDEQEDRCDCSETVGAIIACVFFLVLSGSQIATALLLSKGNERLERIEQKLSPPAAAAPALPEAEKPPRADDLGGCEVCGK